MARATAVALILLLGASPGAAAERSPAAPPPDPGARGERRLDEVRIVGSAESPDVLFFLPRARFRLLPPRPPAGWKERILADSPDLEKPPR